MGFQTRHASNNGKNPEDLELTVEALTHLYENPNIDVFMIISSDRDIIPLLKAIKYKNKLSYVISTQNDLNPIVTRYADFHEYIEDIFGLTPPIVNEDPLETLIAIDADTVSLLNFRRAKEVARYFYKSYQVAFQNILINQNATWYKNQFASINTYLIANWLHIRERASALGKPVNLKGYLDVVAKVVNRHPDEILDDFRLAHCLKYVTIYPDPERGLCLKEGKNMGEVG